MITLNEKEELIPFKSEDDKISKLKSWDLLSKKATKIKEFKYKGIYVDVETPCQIVGYILKYTNNDCIDMAYETVVIDIDGILHKISPMYLKQMQNKSFKIGEVEE